MSFIPTQPIRNPPIPLSMAERGRDVRLVAVLAGRGLTRRLADMGFVPGVEIRVISNDAAGPIVVLVRGSRLVLGRGMAHKMLVQ